MNKTKIILKRVGLIFLSFAIAVLIGFSSVKHPNTIVASAYTGTSYTLGINSADTPSGMGDPYYKMGLWFHETELYEALENGQGSFLNLNTGVLNFTTQNGGNYSNSLQGLFGDFQDFIQVDINGSHFDITITLTNSVESIDIIFGPDSTINVYDYSSMMTTPLTITGGYPVNDYYILPYNDLHVSNITYRLEMTTWSYQQVYYEARMQNSYPIVSYFLYQYLPIYQSVEFIKDNGGVTPDVDADYEGGFDAGYNKGYNKGYDKGFDEGYDSAESYYQNLVEQARQEGFNSGKYVGISEGRAEGLEEGKLIGRTEGFNDGVQEYIRTHGDFSWYGLFSAVVEVPVYVFSSLFDFEVMGVNLAGFLVSILSILVMVFILKKIL